MRIGWHGAWDRRARHSHAAPAVLRLARAARDALESERDRWILWCPVFLGLGIVLYFELTIEPAWWIGLAAVSLAVVGAVACRRSSSGLVVGIAVALAAFGFARAQLQTALVATPVLEKRIGPKTVTGRVVHLEKLTRGHRFVLERISISGLPERATPVRLRIRSMQPIGEIVPGDAVRVRAILLPPPGPAAPGAFDFGRRLYFQRIGGVGFTVGRLAQVDEGLPAGTGVGFSITRLRRDATDRILASLDPPSGAVAAALMTGERGAIPDDVLDAMRDAGLAHLLAISGLHMGLVAGLLFFALRLALSMVPPLALRYPIKKWAAAAAIVGAFGYLLISGATIPTQRAFAMTFVVLLAVLFDRSAISMRLVAWAAAIVLMIAPESLVSASFQLSFAAVVALVAFYEALRPRWSGWRAERRASRRVAIYLLTILLTTVVAGMATAPFAIASFNRLATYGVVANLVAVPVTGLWIMPWAILAFLLMPLGLEGLALAPMGWGLDLVVAVAKTVAGWPGSVRLIPAPPVAMTALVALGGLWLCLWRGRWRAFGAVVVLSGLAFIGLARAPDVLVDGDSGLMAVRLPTGQYAVSSTRRTFTADIWLRRGGEATAASWPRHGGEAVGGLSCDPRGCIRKGEGPTIVLARHRAALQEDCRPGAVVISLVPVWRRHCRGALRLIRPFDLWRDGAHAIWLDGDEVRLRSVRSETGERPWTAAGRWAARRTKGARNQ